MDIITYALCKKADKEIIDMIHDMEGMTVQIVDEVPTVQEAQYNVMYLVDTNGDGKYEAYIKAKISGVDQIISLGSIIDLSDFYTKSEIDTALAGKQPLLTWDNVPTLGSSNAISSGAIYAALDKIKIEEMPDAEYVALTTKNPDKVYFVYEAEEDNRTVIVKNSNGDFVYSASIYGVVTNGTPGWDKFATDSDAPTTPPTKAAPQLSGTSLMFSYTTTEKTVYFNRFRQYAPNAGGRATDSDASNCYFTISGTDNNQYSIVTAYDTLYGPFVTLSTGDYVEFATVPKPNGFRRIYKGDELYVTNEKPNADDIAYDNTNSGLTATTTQDAIDELNTNDVGKKEYVNNELKGEIFNTYSGNGKNIASGDQSHAEGLGTTAEGSESHAEGLHTAASGNMSHAEGNTTKANGSSSHAEGDNTIANGSTSHAEGYGTITKGQFSHAEGYYTTTVRNHSHAEGDNTVAVGVASHTEGVGTKALEQASHAGGYYTKSAKRYETVIGKYNLPFEDTDLIVSELIDNSYYLLTIPVYKIYYYNSYTLSATSIAIPSELKEHLPSSVGDYGIPYVICDNNEVETELWGCLRTDAAGEEKTASIPLLPSNQNYLKNYNSSTLYIKVYADTTQLIDVYWKKTTETIPDSLFVIGNGRDGGNRSNIVEVDTTSLNVNGDIKQNGTIIDFSGSDVGKKEYVDGEPQGEIFNTYSGVLKNEATGTGSHAEGTDTIASGDFSHAEGASSQATGDYGHAEGVNSRATTDGAHAEGGDTQANGRCSHAEGSTTQANGNYSHAEGDTTKVYAQAGHTEGGQTIVGSAVVDPETGNTSYTGSSAKYAHAEGNNSIAARQAAHAEGISTIASGLASHAEGSNTIASGPYAHTEGSHTTASGDYAHAEGESTSATQTNAHAEGDHTQATKRATHAEGTYTQANGISSHAGGFYTIANSKASTVIGKYNDPDSADPTSFGKLFAIGNGTADNARSNILEVSDNYMNLNGIFKQNGQIRDLSSLDKISDLEAYIGYTDNDILGLEIDFENKIFTRLAGAVGRTAGADFNTFAMYGGRKICNLANDGTINAWLGDNNYAEDGSNGQVMLYQPKFYYRVVPLKLEPIMHDYYDVAQEKDITVQGDGWQIKKVRYYICAEPRAGFKVYPAFLDENGNEVEGIYTGVYPGSIYDNSESKYLKYDTWDVTDNDGVKTINSYDGFTLDTSADMLSSIAGVKPASGEFANCPLTRINFEAAAKNRGTGWHIETSKVQMMENLLMMIEFAGMNMQTAIENGVVNYASGTHNESVYTGSTAALGEGTGYAASTSRLITDATADSTDSRASYRSIRYRGKEDIWGDIWEFNCDILMHGNGEQRDGGGRPCICNDFAYTDSVTATSAIPANYNEVSFTAMSQSGYISAIGYDKDYDWLFVGTERKGNTTLPVGDYTYVSNTVQNIAPAGETAINKVVSGIKGFRVAYRGGSWNNGGNAGPFCWNLAYSVGARTRSIGARLFYLPQS